MQQMNHRLPSDTKRRRFIKAQAQTNPHFGKPPGEMTVNELLNRGMINLDKPSGPTSHQIVSWIKEVLEITSAGHGGTLDPAVTGVLPVALNDATRALQVLLGSGKEYVGIMKLHKPCKDNKIREVCAGFVGDIYQVPPVRSAVKRVRRKRHVYYLDILEIQGSEVLFQVGCEAGTYVRTLCVDIGKKLGCGAHLAMLRRTRVGSLLEEDAVTLHDLKDAYVFWKENGDEGPLRSTILPMEQLLGDVPKIVIRDSAVDALCHGANLAIPGVVEVDSGIQRDMVAAVVTLKGEGVALVHTKFSTEQILEKDTGICGTLERVLMNKGTYPSIWKKS
jgi:H/ACA ribonucleoprotein complex subunit 4